MNLMQDFALDLVDFMPADRESRFDLPANVACKGSIWDYLALNEICEYRIEYHEGLIISLAQHIYEPMNNHERIVSCLIFLLNEYVRQNDLSWDIFTSNVLIYIHDALKPHCYKPDASIFEKEPTEVEFTNPKDNKTYKANSDPKVVMEVLSASTSSYDLKVKLKNYKKIASLQQIIFVEQNKMGVYVHERMGNHWLESKYFEENESVFILDCAVLLKKLYRNVKF